MSNMITTDPRRTWLRITLSHEYYEKNSYPITLVPTEETRLLFQRLGMLFLQYRPAEWLVAAQEGMPEREALAGATLVLGIQPVNPGFYYVTEDELCLPEGCSAKKAGSPVIWKQIEIDSARFAGQEAAEIPIRIRTFRKYHEYLFIPKYAHPDTIIRFAEIRGRVRFRKATQVELPGIPRAFRFLSEEKIRLTDSYDLGMLLWESDGQNEHLLYDGIPVPKPEQTSIISPRDTISTYFYY